MERRFIIIKVKKNKIMLIIPHRIYHFDRTDENIIKLNEIFKRYLTISGKSTSTFE